MSKLHKQAKELLQGANKVYHYRRDVTSESRIQDLEHAVSEVDVLIKKGASPAETEPLKAAMDRLDALLRKIGGKIYPKTFWSDNIEVILVAIIVVIGIRTFFFQPFIIPTNSMYPTYSGMNAVVYDQGADRPGALAKTVRLLTLGARHYDLVAQNSGNILIPVSQSSHGGAQILVEQVPAKKFFVLPTVKAKYTILVDGVPHTLTVPPDFGGQMQEIYEKVLSLKQGSLIRTPDVGTGYALDTGIKVKAGDSIVSFDITLGDALFVDRLSYHFIRPKAGDPFVFRTGEIKGIEGNPNTYVDKYYIKRIGGAGGETIEIRDGALLVDGAPRDEVEAFGRNANKEGEYDGYINHSPFFHARQAGFSGLSEGGSVVIPDDKFVALGDNSDSSLDSRYWGFVPEKAVIGKAIFIYYPFTKRWGVAE
jgi:signal peptidase I